MSNISEVQRKKIYASAREAGLDNEMLHTVVFRETEKEHISELTKAEAVKVIDVLCGKGASLKHPASNRASSRQISYIKGLASDMSWDDKRLTGFVKKVGRVDSINWLDKYSASKVIEGLKKLKEKGEAVYGSK